MRKLLLLLGLVPSLAFGAAATWSNPSGTTSLAVCSQAGVTCDAPTLATEGLPLDNVQGLTVTACAASGQTLSGAGSLLAYRYDATIGVWSRVPDMDLTNATGSVRCVTFAGIFVASPRGRIAWVPSTVTASSNSVTVYVISEKRN